MSQEVSPERCILIGCGEEAADPDGLCDAHSKMAKGRRRRQVRMTPAELREHGVDVAISHGGVVVRQRS